MSITSIVDHFVQEISAAWAARKLYVCAHIAAFAIAAIIASVIVLRITEGIYISDIWTNVMGIAFIGGCIYLVELMLIEHFSNSWGP